MDLSATEGMPPSLTVGHNQTQASLAAENQQRCVPLSGREEDGVTHPRDIQSQAGSDAREKRAQIWLLQGGADAPGVGSSELQQLHKQNGAEFKPCPLGD